MLAYLLVLQLTLDDAIHAELCQNSAPSFSLTVPEPLTVRGAGPHTFPGAAINISPGINLCELAQSLNFQVDNGVPELFSVQPAMSSNGTLSFTTISVIGGCEVAVQLKDDGGTDCGGVDTSPMMFFSIRLLGESWQAECAAHTQFTL